jgi:hypothetical protein
VGIDDLERTTPDIWNALGNALTPNTFCAFLSDVHI